jgi:hypothetical protein
MTENERIGLVFVNTGSINSGTVSIHTALWGSIQTDDRDSIRTDVHEVIQSAKTSGSIQALQCSTKLMYRATINVQ